MSNENRFIPEVEAVLRQAGWFPGRKVSEEEIQSWESMYPLFPAAHRVLEEFAGIHIPSKGMGINGAYLEELSEDGYLRINPEFRSSIYIEPVISRNFFELDPDEGQAYYGVKVRSIGIRDYYPGSYGDWKELSVDERGRVFLHCGGTILTGNTIEQALHNLILNTGLQPWDIKTDSPHPGFSE